MCGTGFRPLGMGSKEAPGTEDTELSPEVSLNLSCCRGSRPGSPPKHKEASRTEIAVFSGTLRDSGQAGSGERGWLERRKPKLKW